MLCFLTGGTGIFGFVKIRERNLQIEKGILEDKVEMRTKQLREEKEITDEEIKDTLLSREEIENFNQLQSPKTIPVGPVIKHQQDKSDETWEKMNE